MEAKMNRRMEDNSSSSGTRDGKRKQSRRDPFSPRPFLGRNDMVVDLNLGKVVIPKDEMEQDIVKEEKTTEDIEMEIGQVQVAVDEEMERHIPVKDSLEMTQEEDLEVLETSSKPCPCACWTEITFLKALVEAQGEQIQNLNRAIVGLLGKQLELESNLATYKPAQENESKVEEFPVPDPISTQANEKHDGVGGDTGTKVKTSAKEQGPVLGLEGDLPIAIHAIEGKVVPPSTRPPPQLELSGSEMNGNTENSCTTSVSKPTRNVSPPPHQRAAAAAGKSGKVTDAGLPKTFGKTNRSRSEGKFTCSQCSSAFANSNALQSHIIAKHRLRKDQFKCDQCDKMFSRKEFLERHLKSVHQGIRYQCSYCTGSYTNKFWLAQHEKLHLEGVPLKRCNLCGLDAISETALSRHHIKYHDGEGTRRKHRKRKENGREKARPPAKKKIRVQKPEYQCSHCEMRFDCNASLRYHLHKRHGILEPVPAT